MLGRRLRVCCLLWVLAVGVGLAESGACQEGTGTTLPAFDVVSVRKIDTSQRIGGGYLGTPTKACQYSDDHVRCQLSLWQYIEEAWKISEVQLDSGNWLSDDIFVFQATMPPNTDKETARRMMQKALLERFGMRFHREAREIPVYALVAAKHGIKLKLADPDPARRKLKTGQGPMGAKGAMLASSPGEFFAAGITLDFFATRISNMVDLDAPVVNMTGLTGEYLFDLHWPPPESVNGHIPQYDPAFRDVMEQQLGLKLEKRKATYQMFVVDHAERMPTEN